MKARCLPSLKAYIEKFGKLPANLTLSLAALIRFYSCDVQELTQDALSAAVLPAIFTP